MKDPTVPTQQKYEILIQANLRDTLGAAFTEREAIEFFSRAYDELASNEDLIDRMNEYMQGIIDKTDFQIQRFNALTESLVTKDDIPYIEFMRKGYVPGASGFPPSQTGTQLKSGNQGSVITIPGVQRRN